MDSNPTFPVIVVVTDVPLIHNSDNFLTVELLQMAEWTRIEEILQVPIPKQGTIQSEDLIDKPLSPLAHTFTIGDNFQVDLQYHSTSLSWTGTKAQRVLKAERINAICVSVSLSEDIITVVSHKFKNFSFGRIHTHLVTNIPNIKDIKGQFFTANFRILSEQKNELTYVGINAEFIPEQAILASHEYYSPSVPPVSTQFAEQYRRFFFDIRLAAELYDHYLKKLQEQEAVLQNVSLTFEDDNIPATAHFTIPNESSMRLKKFDKLLIYRQTRDYVPLGKILVKDISILTSPIKVTIEFSRIISIDLKKQGLREPEQLFKLVMFTDLTNLKRLKKGLSKEKLVQLFSNNSRGQLCRQLIGSDPTPILTDVADIAPDFLNYFQNYAESPKHLRIAYEFLHNPKVLISCIKGVCGSAKTSLLVRCLLMYIINNPKCFILILASANSVCDELTLGVNYLMILLLNEFTKNKEKPPRICRLLTDRRYKLLKPKAPIHVYTIQNLALKTQPTDEGEMLDKKQKFSDLSNEIDNYVPDMTTPRQNRLEKNAEMHEKLNDWKKLREELYTLYFETIKPQIVVSTCQATATPTFYDQYHGKFDLIIIDEVAFCLELEIWINLSFLKPEGHCKFLSAGDSSQNNPLSFSRSLAGRLRQQSMLERLDQFMDLPTLTNCYRFHPELMKFISQIFYGNTLTCAIPLDQRTSLLNIFPWPNPSIPMCWIPSCYKDTLMGHSRNNHQENEMITMCYKFALMQGVLAKDIGLLVQYNSAKDHLAAMMHENGIPNVTEETVQTTDAAQGASKKLIILACQRSLGPNYHVPANPSETQKKRSLGYLISEKRSLVSLSRMQSGLIIISDNNLLRMDSIWEQVVQYFEDRQLISSEFYQHITDAVNSSR